MKKEKKTAQFTIRVKEEHYDFIQRIAEKLDMPSSQIVRYAIKHHVLEVEDIQRDAVKVCKDVKDSYFVVRVTEDDNNTLIQKAESLKFHRSDLVRHAIIVYIEDIQSTS